MVATQEEINAVNKIGQALVDLEDGVKVHLKYGTIAKDSLIATRLRELVQRIDLEGYED